MNIKYATNEDIAEIAAVEAECFPPAESATEKEFVERVTVNWHYHTNKDGWLYNIFFL